MLKPFLERDQITLTPSRLPRWYKEGERSQLSLRLNRSDRKQGRKRQRSNLVVLEPRVRKLGNTPFNSGLIFHSQGP